MVTFIEGNGKPQSVITNKANNKGKTNKAVTSTTSTPQKLQGADDSVEISKPKMPKLTSGQYEIKDGDSLQKIANALGLKLTDLVDQLKEQGKLEKDYDPSVRHKTNIPWMKKGKSIDVSYPKTESQKNAYEKYTDARTKEYYNNKAKKDAAAKAAAKAAEKEAEANKGFWAKLFGS